jgi:methylenetetrahydrofolate dehydrogenase (NADP+)/methenyltetrahydrofolate cyclohydrolase
MIINGKQIAQDIKTHLAERSAQQGDVGVAIVTVGGSAVTSTYLNIKKKFAEAIGARVVMYSFEETNSEEEIVRCIHSLNTQPDIRGIVVQLPLPHHIDTHRVLQAIAPEKDVDALGLQSRFLSPVVLAVQEVLRRGEIEITGKNVLVVGHGRLVGRPLARWLTTTDARVTVVDNHTPQLADHTRGAEIIIAGVGSPGLITPDMITEGVVLIDVGTSESSGKVTGDIDPRCVSKAALYTPVPGGVGPITVAMLFKNVVG